MIDEKINRIHLMLLEIPSALKAMEYNRKKEVYDIVDKNLNGKISKLADAIQIGITELTSKETKESEISKQHVMKECRTLERKIDETIDAIEKIAEIEGVDVKELGIMGIQYDALKYIRREILPDIEGVATAYSMKNEKMANKMANNITEMRKAINMAENGIPYIPQEEK